MQFRKKLIDAMLAGRSNPRRAKQSLLGRSLLRGPIDQTFAIDGRDGRDWRVLANSDGKPYVCSVDREPGRAVSVSHSDSPAAVAVTQPGALGIDIMPTVGDVTACI